MRDEARRLEHRPRASARPLHGRAPHHPADAARADRQGGWPAALAPIIAACRRAGEGAASSARRPRRRAAGPPARAPARPPRPPAAPPEPTPPPVPEAELHIWNYAEYIGEDDIPSFEKKLQGRHQGQLGLLRHVRGDVRAARPRRRRLRHHVPAVDRHPGRSGAASDLPLDLSLLPEHQEPGHRMGEPGLRPGQRALDAVHVVDDRRRLRHGQDQGGADQLEGPLGRGGR